MTDTRFLDIEQLDRMNREVDSHLIDTTPDQVELNKALQKLKSKPSSEEKKETITDENKKQMKEDLKKIEQFFLNYENEYEKYKVENREKFKNNDFTIAKNFVKESKNKLKHPELIAGLDPLFGMDSENISRTIELLGNNKFGKEEEEAVNNSKFSTLNNHVGTVVSYEEERLIQLNKSLISESFPIALKLIENGDVKTIEEAVEKSIKVVKNQEEEKKRKREEIEAKIANSTATEEEQIVYYKEQITLHQRRIMELISSISNAEVNHNDLEGNYSSELLNNMRILTEFLLGNEKAINEEIKNNQDNLKRNIEGVELEYRAINGLEATAPLPKEVENKIKKEEEEKIRKLAEEKVIREKGGEKLLEIKQNIDKELGKSGYERKRLSGKFSDATKTHFIALDKVQEELTKLGKEAKLNYEITRLQKQLNIHKTTSVDSNKTPTIDDDELRDKLANLRKEKLVLTKKRCINERIQLSSIVNKANDENRPLTPEEQQIIVNYVNSRKTKLGLAKLTILPFLNNIEFPEGQSRFNNPLMNLFKKGQKGEPISHVQEQELTNFLNTIDPNDLKKLKSVLSIPDVAQKIDKMCNGMDSSILKCIDTVQKSKTITAPSK